MLDCAEGTQGQSLKSGPGFKDLYRIFLNDGYLDHILGIGRRWARERALDLMKVALRGKTDFWVAETERY